jgi:16S rRNA (uracil1498-N3)-methyltransferase
VALPRFLVPEFDRDARVVRLPDDEAHHAARVLRLGPGDAVRIFDGAGGEWAARIESTNGSRVDVVMDGQVDAVREADIALTLAIGLLKGDQMDSVVRDATALGVAIVQPLVSTRVVAPSRARVEAAQTRWRRVAVQAAKQCGRAVVPEVAAPIEWADLLARPGYARRVMLAEPQTGDGAHAMVARPDMEGGGRPSVLLLVGPEGGWTADEVRQAAASGVSLWRIGPRTLRAELAPTVALSALWTAWGW